MSKLTPEIAAALLDACKAGAAEAAGLLSSALDGAMQIADVAAIENFSPAALPNDFQGPGLVILLHVGEEAAALFLPEATNLLPPWYASPDATGESKLQTLAQELSALLLPEELAIKRFEAIVLEDMAVALETGSLGEAASGLRLAVTGDDGNGDFYLIWPLTSASALSSSRDAAETAATSHERFPASQTHGPGVESLPSYSRSLLSVRVPVIVTLAQTKRRVEEVVKLGSGDIIQFEKSCDSTLTLEAGGQNIAEGEAVKVGEKFGLRITSIRLPEERLKPVGK